MGAVAAPVMANRASPRASPMPCPAPSAVAAVMASAWTMGVEEYARRLAAGVPPPQWRSNATGTGAEPVLALLVDGRLPVWPVALPSREAGLPPGLRRRPPCVAGVDVAIEHSAPSAGVARCWAALDDSAPRCCLWASSGSAVGRRRRSSSVRLLALRRAADTVCFVVHLQLPCVTLGPGEAATACAARVPGSGAWSARGREAVDGTPNPRWRSHHRLPDAGSATAKPQAPTSHRATPPRMAGRFLRCAAQTGTARCRTPTGGVGRRCVRRRSSTASHRPRDLNACPRPTSRGATAPAAAP